jgi:hypothetical protein
MSERAATRQTEVLRRVLEAHASDQHTGVPGKVRSYDRDTQTAEIEVLVRRVLPAGDDDDPDTIEDYPILPSVPVLWPRGGGYFLHAPLAAGDHVYVLFAECDLNAYRTTGQVSDPGVGTRHGLSGAVAVPGMFWRGDPVDLPSEVSGLIVGREGGAQIVITTGTIEAGGDETIAKAEPQGAINDAIVADLQTLAAAINLIAPGAVTVPTSAQAIQAANPIATATLLGA